MFLSWLFERLAYLLPVLVAVAILLAYLYISADGDFTLLWFEKFGKPVGSLRGKVAWVTGAASGIGRELCLLLSQNGVRLILSDIDSEKLEQVKQECLKRSSLNERDLFLLPFNLTETKLHQECLDKVVAHFGQLNVMFHNAGCSQRAEYTEITNELDKELFDVNCFGHVSLSRVVLKHYLLKGEGHFVVTSSMLGKCAYARASTYVASKHALIGYFESLRIEYSTKNINVTIICPGPVFSGLYDKSFTEKVGQFYAGGMKVTDRRMPASRCAHLMAVATANRVEEAWPCLQPALSVFYVGQYAPTIYKRLVCRFLRPEFVDTLRDGRLKIR